MEPAETAGWGTMQCPRDGAIVTSRVPARDGVSLFYRAWRTRGEDAVLLIHGLGGHGGWYIDAANALADREISVLVPDLRGFGRSGGLRGHVRRARQLLDDLEIMSKHALMETGAVRLHVVGHSMGAILALHLARQRMFCSLSVINPWVEDTESISPLLVARIVLEGLFGSTRLWKLGGGAERMTDNPDAREYLKNDPFWQQAQTSSFLTQIVGLRLLASRTAHQLTLPAQVIQTQEDLVVRHAASRRLLDAFASPDRKWCSPPGLPHDFQFSADHHAVEDLLAHWVREHRESPVSR